MRSSPGASSSRSTPSTRPTSISESARGGARSRIAGEEQALPRLRVRSKARLDVDGEDLDAAVAKRRHGQPGALPCRFDGDIDGTGEISRERIALGTRGV